MLVGYLHHNPQKTVHADVIQRFSVRGLCANIKVKKQKSIRKIENKNKLGVVVYVVVSAIHGSCSKVQDQPWAKVNDW